MTPSIYIKKNKLITGCSLNIVFFRSIKIYFHDSKPNSCRLKIAHGDDNLQVNTQVDLYFECQEVGIHKRNFCHFFSWPFSCSRACFFFLGHYFFSFFLDRFLARERVFSLVFFSIFLDRFLGRRHFFLFSYFLVFYIKFPPQGFWNDICRSS